MKTITTFTLGLICALAVGYTPPIEQIEEGFVKHGDYYMFYTLKELDCKNLPLELEDTDFECDSPISFIEAGIAANFHYVLSDAYSNNHLKDTLLNSIEQPLLDDYLIYIHSIENCFPLYIGKDNIHIPENVNLDCSKSRSLSYIKSLKIENISEETIQTKLVSFAQKNNFILENTKISEGVIFSITPEPQKGIIIPNYWQTVDILVFLGEDGNITISFDAYYGAGVNPPHSRDFEAMRHGYTEEMGAFFIKLINHMQQ